MSGRARRRRRKKEEEGEEEKRGKRKRGVESGERECRVEGKRRRVRATGVGKPYACTECNYRTPHKGHLTVHMRTHTGDKPYACNKCNYRAAQMSNLTVHMRKHKMSSIPNNTRQLRRCSDTFELFDIKEFATLSESLKSLHAMRQMSA